MSHYGGHFIRDSTRNLIHERDKWRCLWCSNPVTRDAHVEPKATLDHVLPRSKGGSHHPSNLITACALCNSRRQDRVAIDFAFYIEPLVLRSAHFILSDIIEAMGTPIRPASIKDRLLEKVAECPGLTAQQYARALREKPATVSGALCRLADAGLVRRRTLPALKRNVYTTTEKVKA